MFQKAKKQRTTGGKWVDVVEDLARVRTPQAVQARRALADLVLRHAEAAPGESLVAGLLGAVPTTDADSVVQGVVNLYLAAGQGELVLPLITSFIRDEVAQATRAETLFRVNSAATKMMKFFRCASCGPLSPAPLTAHQRRDGRVLFD